MTEPNLDPAVEKVIASIGDEEMAPRYPNRAHFISAGNPHQGEMATEALFAGDPVVIVYLDGHELGSPRARRRGCGAVSRRGGFLLEAPPSQGG